MLLALVLAVLCPAGSELAPDHLAPLRHDDPPCPIERQLVFCSCSDEIRWDMPSHQDLPAYAFQIERCRHPADECMIVGSLTLSGTVWSPFRDSPPQVAGVPYRYRIRAGWPGVDGMEWGPWSDPVYQRGVWRVCWERSPVDQVPCS